MLTRNVVPFANGTTGDENGQWCQNSSHLREKGYLPPSLLTMRTYLLVFNIA